MQCLKLLENRLCWIYHENMTKQTSLFLGTGSCRFDYCFSTEFLLQQIYCIVCQIITLSHLFSITDKSTWRESTNTWAYGNSLSAILKRQYMKLQKVQMMSLSLPGPCSSEVSFLPHSHLAKQRSFHLKIYFH